MPPPVLDGTMDTVLLQMFLELWVLHPHEFHWWGQVVGVVARLSVPPCAGLGLGPCSGRFVWSQSAVS